MTLVRDRITAFAADHLIDLTGVDGNALRGSGTRRDSRRDIAQALDFAYGIDAGGRRLPLVADTLPPQLLRRAPIVRERDDPRWAAIYAAADHFDDGQPNVIMLTHRRDETPRSTDRVVDRQPPRGGLSRTVSSQSRNAIARSAHDRESAPRTGRASAFRGASAPSARGSSVRGSSVRESSSRGSSTRGSSSRQGVDGRRQLRTFADDRVGLDDGYAVQGATALSVDQRANDRREDSRFQLRLVGRRSKVSGGVGVVAFWTVFVVAMMFAAVVMWAQNTTRLIQLEKMNQKLATAESSYTQLRVEVARLQSPQRIESEAKRLGLSTPANITFIAPDRSVAVSPSR